jgi:predicted DNA-binding transcriptional regulator AlpA
MRKGWILERRKMATATNFEKLMTEHEVAQITEMSVATVRRWRLLGQGPKYIKLGTSVRYRREDLAGWLNSRPSGGELAVGNERSFVQVVANA